MPRRTNYGKAYEDHKADEVVEEKKEKGFESFYVRERDLRVRIRTAPRVTSEFTGNYLGDGEHKISQIAKGEGSESGWGYLASGAGWVALDYVERVSK